jgi:hypothetical protein
LLSEDDEIADKSPLDEVEQNLSLFQRGGSRGPGSHSASLQMEVC